MVRTHCFSCYFKIKLYFPSSFPPFFPPRLYIHALHTYDRCHPYSFSFCMWFPRLIMFFRQELQFCTHLHPHTYRLLLHDEKLVLFLPSVHLCFCLSFCWLQLSQIGMPCYSFLDWSYFGPSGQSPALEQLVIEVEMEHMLGLNSEGSHVSFY